MSLIVDLESKRIPMKNVFTLRKELQADPARIKKTQDLTLNNLKPKMGLSGKYGLFGSEKWWDSIATKKMPLEHVSGLIVRAYVAGQDPDRINTVDVRRQDGEVQAVGIYLNNENDRSLFQVGHLISIVYALDELKLQPGPDGGVNFSKIALEMDVSLNPAVDWM